MIWHIILIIVVVAHAECRNAREGSFFRRRKRSPEAGTNDNDESYQWPNGQIPFIISDKLNDTQRAMVAWGMDQIHSHTCVRFIPRVSQADYVYVHLGSEDCQADMGRVGGKQEIGLKSDCYDPGTILHEMMHTLGFEHEMSRPDRDNYIKVLWDNVEPDHRDAFERLSYGTEENELVNLDTTYDFASQMHYSNGVYSKNGKDTIETIPKGIEIGWVDLLSPMDVYRINKFYSCPNIGPLPAAPKPFDYDNYDPCVDYVPECGQVIPEVCRTSESIRERCGKSCGVCAK